MNECCSIGRLRFIILKQLTNVLATEHGAHGRIPYSDITWLLVMPSTTNKGNTSSAQFWEVHLSSTEFCQYFMFSRTFAGNWTLGLSNKISQYDHGFTNINPSPSSFFLAAIWLSDETLAVQHCVVHTVRRGEWLLWVSLQDHIWGCQRATENWMAQNFRNLENAPKELRIG